MSNAKQENIVCYNCSKELDIEPDTKILKNEECLYCYASLHCCRMCRFYDKSAYNECREPNAERIVDKEKANYCEYFDLNGFQRSKEPDKKDLFAQANALFKD